MKNPSWTALKNKLCVLFTVVFQLTIDCQTDGQPLVEQPDLTLQAEHLPGQAELGGGEGGCQEQGGSQVPGGPHLTLLPALGPGGHLYCIYM